jgi:hypothetical protein
MLRKLLLASCLLLLPFCSQSQSRFLSSPEEARRAAEGIIASVAAGNPSGALKELRPLSVIPATEFDVFEAQFNSQQVNVLRQFGAPLGYEYIREEKLGTRLLRQHLLVFHDKSPLRWNFVFYKAEKGWVLSHFQFDGNAISFFAGGG